MIEEPMVMSSERSSGRTIVAGIDGSASSIRALHWAARQAQLTGSPLEVITAWEWPSNYGWSIPLPDGYDPASDAQRLLDDCIPEVRKTHPDLDLQTRVVQGHPAPTLVQASRDADLLVVGSRGHGEFTGMLLGSVSEYCVANADCPVVVTRGHQ
jgi:nucleotide-binding universal stress UspA family protein